jgi:hypothetical protein
LFGELEHLKMETRLTDEKFASVIGECVIFCDLDVIVYDESMKREVRRRRRRRVLIATCRQLVWSIRIGRNMPI